MKAALRIRHRGCRTEKFHGETVLTQISGERGADVFVLRAADADALAEGLAIAESDTVKAEILSRDDESIIFKGRNEPAGIIATIRASPCWILWPVVYRDGLEYYTIAGPTREALRELVARIGELGDVDIEHVSEGAPDAAEETISLGDLVSDLTPRQLAALRLAIARGYYRSPRDSTSDTLADEFGVSSSTMREHLRKAEQAVLARVAQLLEERPFAARRAARGTGRPRARKL